MVLLLSFLTHPVLPSLPLALQFSPAQLVSVLLAALAVSRALSRMAGRSGQFWLSGEVMFSVALLSIVLSSDLPGGDGVQDATRPDLGAALMVRVVMGGLFVSVWHSLWTRVRARPARA